MAVWMRAGALLLIVGAASAAEADGTVAVDLAAARASLAGVWRGQLEYRDYSANRWFGIPVVTRISNESDGVTSVRRAEFDDGPDVGTVLITTVELLDPVKRTLAVGSFRKGRGATIDVYSVRLTAAISADHWTLVEETDGRDDDRPARLRLTTVRDGNRLETLKEVDFLDDEGATWLTRNRTRLTRSGDAAAADPG